MKSGNRRGGEKSGRGEGREGEKRENKKKGSRRGIGNDKVMETGKEKRQWGMERKVIKKVERRKCKRKTGREIEENEMAMGE